MPTMIETQSELLDVLKAEVIRIGAERDAALAEVERLRPDAARLDLLDLRMRHATWVECGRGRILVLKLQGGGCTEGTTIRQAIDRALAVPNGEC